MPRKSLTKHKNIDDIEDAFWCQVMICEHGEKCKVCCWLWEGELDQSGGYGVFYLEGRQVGAHRVCMMLRSGSLTLNPRRFHICHKCDNPQCVSPSHLFVGSVSDNIRGAAKRRILRAGREC